MTRNIWVSSDHHLFQENMMKFKDNEGNLIRGAHWDNATQMNEEILERHNSVVKPGDIHYCLGDLLMNTQNEAEFRSIWTKFNGSKRLIVGNHDPIIFFAKGGFFKKITESRNFKEYKLLLTHRPAHLSQMKDIKGNLISYNIHGHIHQHKSPEGPYKNVSLEAINYTPVHIEDLALEAKNFLGSYDQHE